MMCESILFHAFMVSGRRVNTLTHVICQCNQTINNNKICPIQCEGARRYLLNEKDEDLPRARQKYKR